MHGIHYHCLFYIVRICIWERGEWENEKWSYWKTGIVFAKFKMWGHGQGDVGTSG